MIEGLVVTGKRGRYGLNKIYRVAGHAVGYRIRTEHQDRIYAGRPGFFHGDCLRILLRWRDATKSTKVAIEPSSKGCRKTNPACFM